MTKTSWLPLKKPAEQFSTIHLFVGRGGSEPPNYSSAYRDNNCLGIFFVGRLGTALI